MSSRADISLLFDFFVTAQRIKRVLTDALSESGMRPDEYAVYSLLFERGPLTATEMAGFLAMPLTTVLDFLKDMTAAGHLVRTSHPFDGRAVQVSLNRSGISAQKRAHAHWDVVRKQIEDGLPSVRLVRSALRALDVSVEKAGRQQRLRRAKAAQA